MSNGILRRSSPGMKRSPVSPSVHFEAPLDLGEILMRYAEKGGSGVEVEGLMTHAHNLRGEALVSWIVQLQENISLLDKRLESFTCSLLKNPWAASSESRVSRVFVNFLINLLSAHIFYLRPVVKSLMANFSASREFTPEVNDLIYKNTHDALKAILGTFPLDGRREVSFSLRESMPYVLTPKREAHTSYAQNLLGMISYSPEMRANIICILIDRAVQLDVRLPKDCLENNEEEEDQVDMDIDDSVSAVTCKTDTCPVEKAITIAKVNMEDLMQLMFKHIKENTGDGLEKGKSLYFDFLKSFESHVLPTWATTHVQFVMFYFSSINPSYAAHFLNWLWIKFLSPNTPSIIRQSSIAYIGSLIARAKFIHLNLAKRYLENIVLWIHSYIKTSEYSSKDFMYADVKIHGPFYASVQSALYMFAFRHEEFAENKKNLDFLKSLNFNTIVTCQLNPLRVCLPPVTKNFANVSRNYQLAYCDTVIQRNNRISLPVVGSLSEIRSNAKPLLLDSFFPFDPYSLKESEAYVIPLYREYSGNIAASEDESEDSEWEDAKSEGSESLLNDFIDVKTSNI